jgi:hypothetical protein
MNALRVPLYACAAAALCLATGTITVKAAPAAPAAPAPTAAVRVWEGQLELPTYEEGLPDVNPPFDVFETQRFNYPYTLRHNLTDRRAVTSWRTLNLENEYLKVVVLPDLGGHLYSCVDKSNGADMFYANGSIKKARVSYRGAWTALGIEFNFPVSHNWATVSPVDYALQRNADGSASIWVGNQDRVYGMQWRVALTLHPGQARLEQDVALYNRSDTRHRFYWWNNAGVRVWDDSRIEYPQRFTASHGFREIDTWPVNKAGVDLTVVGNHKFGPVSEFSHGSREPFMGVYHPHTRAGVVHYSSMLDSPTKKFWSWGSDPDGLDWRKALSDDDSAYVEIQAGIFRNQETYGFLQPQESVQFREYWMPVRQIGGITRANLDATLHLTRTASSAERRTSRSGLNVTGREGGTLVLKDGPAVVRTEPLTSPRSGRAAHARGLPEAPRYTVEVKDGAGACCSHTPRTSSTCCPRRRSARAPARARDAAARPAQRRATCSKRARTRAQRQAPGRAGHVRGGTQAVPGEPRACSRPGAACVDLSRFTEAAALLEPGSRATRPIPRSSTTSGLAHEGWGRTARRARSSRPRTTSAISAPRAAEAGPGRRARG